MALDATVAGADADSYLSVADADALAAADLGPEVDQWLAAEEADKERALKRATRELDSYVRTGWRQYASTQALTFPRLIDVDADGPFLPRDIRLATYEQATYVLANAKVLDRANTRRARDMQSASEPNLSYSRPTEDDAMGALSEAALAYLVDYGSQGTKRSVRSVRMASGYIP